MNKIFRILGGLLSAAAAIAMLYCLMETLSPGSTINSEIIDSGVDRLFWVLCIGGCAGFYGVISIVLFKDITLNESKILSTAMVITGFACMVGLYYSTIFGSPW